MTQVSFIFVCFFSFLVLSVSFAVEEHLLETVSGVDWMEEDLEASGGVDSFAQTGQRGPASIKEAYAPYDEKEAAELIRYIEE